MLTLAAARALDRGCPNLEFLIIKHLTIPTDILKGCRAFGRDADAGSYDVASLWELAVVSGERLPSIV